MEWAAHPSGWALLVAGLVGLLLGLGAYAAFATSERELRRPLAPPPAPELDDGMVRMLSVLGNAAAVVRPDCSVVRASAAAHALGLVRGGMLAHRQVRDMVAEVRRDGTVDDAELELPRGIATSGTVVLAVRVANLTDQLVLVLAEDHTEAQRVDKLRRDFTANVSHELKTPVGAIGLLAETIEDAADDPAAVRHFARRTRIEAHRLDLLVRDILELSRLEADTSRVEVTPVDIGEVVRSVCQEVAPTASARGVSLWEPEVAGEVLAYADRELVATAVRNLVTNAIAYSPSGTRVRVVVDESDDQVRIAVIDQGIGIAPEHQARIFERFFRADPARARNTGGTGLGLSIVKHVAHTLGGEITVWSRPGEGSTFTLTLPRVPRPDTSQEI